MKTLSGNFRRLLTTGCFCCCDRTKNLDMLRVILNHIELLSKVKLFSPQNTVKMKVVAFVLCRQEVQIVWGELEYGLHWLYGSSWTQYKVNPIICLGPVIRKFPRIRYLIITNSSDGMCKWHVFKQYKSIKNTFLNISKGRI